ncbi:TetR family transcriptional regulator [Blastochloris viridis]|uniref:Toluene efflux pump ttgABC operon repressor n=1 Tax=Blastochloris viridis TaxID=1079 RepID=A0A0H5BEG4_BLAVI|nr:TetR family transcriptional regulator [Blastochloris viridis]ALK10581.1 HTH-type transcriptional regulator TtgR [Blastochloris viridis]BAR99464.1 transcription repressor of multidrug efflux pump acrAB operon [Blastochloris viridis]CUU43243.1 Toluene efflux pump ttgABC operon repressor [Blastochloris viridis]
MRRTKEEAFQTRSDLLDAAEVLFWERGVARTTLEEIARAAGTTRGAIYHHFENKHDLLLTLLDRRLLPHDDDLAKIEADQTADPIVGLRASSRTILERLADDPSQRRVAGILLQRCEPIDDMTETLDIHRRTILRSRERVVRLFERADARGQLAAPWTPRSAAVSLHALITGLIYGWLRAPDDLDLRRDGFACLDAFFAGIVRRHEA